MHKWGGANVASFSYQNLKVFPQERNSWTCLSNQFLILGPILSIKVMSSKGFWIPSFLDLDSSVIQSRGVVRPKRLPIFLRFYWLRSSIWTQELTRVHTLKWRWCKTIIFLPNLNGLQVSYNYVQVRSIVGCLSPKVSWIQTFTMNSSSTLNFQLNKLDLRFMATKWRPPIKTCPLLDLISIHWLLVSLG